MFRSSFLLLCFFTGLVGLLSFPGSAYAKGESVKPSATSSQVSKKASLRPRNISASATLGTSLGAGSFAPSDSYKNHYVSQSLQLNLSYRWKRGFYLNGGWGFDVEYTQPDNSSGERFFSRDISLSAGWSNPIEALKRIIPHGVSLGFLLPTSIRSRTATRILRGELGVNAGYSFGKYVAVRYSFGAAKSFHRYTSPIFDQADGDLPSILLRQSTRDGSSWTGDLAPVPSSRNVSWQLRNALSLQFRLHKTLSLQFYFAIINAFKYAMPNDELTPTIPTSDGPIKADTRGRIDFTVGNVALTWAPLRFLAVSLGAVSQQTPFQASNSGLKFPFFNFATPNDNTTRFYLNITGRY